MCHRLELLDSRGRLLPVLTAAALLLPLKTTLGLKPRFNIRISVLLLEPSRQKGITRPESPGLRVPIIFKTRKEDGWWFLLGAWIEARRTRRAN